MNGNNNLPKVAIISSLSGGLGHYCAHLAGPLSQYAQLKFITYPQVDPSGTVTKQLTDSFVKKYIKWPRFDLDDTNPLSIIYMSEYLKEKEINLVNIHIATTVKKKLNYFTTLVLYLKKVNKAKFVFTLHDVLPFDEDKEFVKLLKVFYDMADFITVGNEYEKDRLMKFFKIPQNKVQVVRHGIYNLFDRGLYNSQMARSYLEIPKDKKILLFFGFLREYKGFDYLVKATKILAKKNDNFLVYVASGLKFASKELVEKELALITKLNVQDKFLLNLTYLDALDLEAVFKATDVVVLPYTHASQSGVMMMSFGFKRPVVMTDIFFDKKWVDGKAGYVAKAKDPQDLADKIQQFLDHPERIQEFGEYGYNYSMENLNWEKIAKEYFAIYKKVL
jgi:glycosyltransferase involved in cell wall biosynthesis